MSVKIMILELFKAFGNTALIFVLTLLGSIPLGLLVYFGRKSRFVLLRGFIKAYISIMRGTPLMLQLMMVFYGPSLLIPLLFPGVKFSLPSNWRFTAVIIAFVINYAAYFCEIFRAGIESIPKGQYEAADVLGLTKSQTFFRIILPQMVKRVIPPVTNEVITLVKDTSLSSAIGTVEMFTKAKQIAVAPKSPGMLTFVAAAVFYYVFNYAVAFLMERIEKKLDYYR
ncbi:MAG: amino acid ABC transporter permease [Clostridia bacterium]|nr:amino acid ABC transporter permease [Clostridia bacterium]